ncbi:LamG-like jellyroll fold domain-containing protein [Mycolicibacterium frederiksbergense]|uniref:LamG-like jellyroll fold domain-containing protein n=1 Tax=Mycolicibacterium frederiksbergense TaxID=117567 RepID=UPI00265BAF18|nr:LamG-like jellyroll fold domain-containing protein [Mycolicibacterium frederiksbergense]MDO0973861.1 hypothetical protein [Mycolicibacterium frederiksbergense]
MRGIQMAQPWELILHHSYSGTPGVIFDQSPARGSHGTAVGLTGDDYLRDGISEGSGAIQFGPGKAVRVPTSKAWHPCRGVMVEVVCRRDAPSEANLITGPSFGFGVADHYMWAGYGVVGGGGGGSNTRQQPITVPVGEWVTLRWVFDGYFSQSYWLNGELVLTGKWTWPLAQSGGSVFIGAHRSHATGLLDNEFDGLIDDVKVWRANPHKIDDEFTSRPTDPAIAECWQKWVRDLTAVFAASPDCAREFNDALQKVMAAGRLLVVANGEPLATTFAVLQARYQELWLQGRLDEIPAVLADLLAAVHDAGIDVLNTDEVKEFQQNSCVQELMSQLKPPDCDAEFVDMATGVKF